MVELSLGKPGYKEKSLPVFKTGNMVAESLNIKYAEPVKFSDDPYLSGFVSDNNLNRIKNAHTYSEYKSYLYK